MIDAQAGMIADRNFHYTAISRASKLCIIVGSRAVIDRQRMKVSIARRKTFLAQQVQDVLWEGI
jgi:hypothetical protein